MLTVEKHLSVAQAEATVRGFLASRTLIRNSPTSGSPAEAIVGAICTVGQGRPRTSKNNNVEDLAHLLSCIYDVHTLRAVRDRMNQFQMAYEARAVQQRGDTVGPLTDRRFQRLVAAFATLLDIELRHDQNEYFVMLTLDQAAVHHEEVLDQWTSMHLTRIIGRMSTGHVCRPSSRRDHVAWTILSESITRMQTSCWTFWSTSTHPMVPQPTFERCVML